MPDRIDPSAYQDVVRRALAEDIGSGDITSRAVIPVERAAAGVLLAKAPLVVAGLDVAKEVFAQVDPDVSFEVTSEDAGVVEPGDRLAIVRGRALSLLAAERTALNILQHLSGVATMTRTFVDAAAPMVVLDTRKTLPGLRRLEKYAVACGGARNHRTGLFDAVLIKDNHIRVAGSVSSAISQARAAGVPTPIEVETQSMAEVDEALAAGADIIMLDNFDDQMTTAAVLRIGGRARVELSGNMTLERVRRLAASGADFVSVGALTHSAPAVDISFEISF